MVVTKHNMVLTFECDLLPLSAITAATNRSHTVYKHNIRSHMVMSCVAQWVVCTEASMCT